MKSNIYITDEGFGPIVRQSAVLEKIRELEPSFKGTVITKSLLDHAKKVMPECSFTERFNNIIWNKQEDGTPEIGSINEFYKNYAQRSEDYVEQHAKTDSCDLIISDFVYEAFKIAQINKVPSFGIAHFTWDWFFNSFENNKFHPQVIAKMEEYGKLATKLYFPPFTPPPVLATYKKNLVNIPLIVRKRSCSEIELNKKRDFKILIIDSGARVLRTRIEKAINSFSNIQGCHFYLSDVFQIEQENVTLIKSSDLFVDYIPHMDLVIGRAGFNTISECIAYRTPMLLLSEGLNPEMSCNISEIRKSGLGAFIGLNDFEFHLKEFLDKFISNEYDVLKKNMQEHTIPCNGDQVVAEDILNTLKGW